MKTKTRTCINSKVGHQMVPLALVTNLATRWRHLHYLYQVGPYCLGLPYWHNQLVLSCYIHQPESAVKFAKGLVLSDLERQGPIDRAPCTHGSEKGSTYSCQPCMGWVCSFLGSAHNIKLNNTKNDHKCWISALQMILC